MGGNVSAERRGKRLAEEYIPVFAALALVDPDFALFQVNVFDFHAAKFAHPDASVEQQPQHQAVLDVICLIDNSVEAPKLVSGQHSG
jgi:hypothetical protein